MVWLAAVAAGAFILLTGSLEPFWHDYGVEGWPADQRLIAGDLDGFFARAPGYIGWMVLRAPLAYVTGQLGGSDQAIFRVGGLLGLAALAWLAVHLATHAFRHVEGRRTGWLVLGLVGASPLAYQAYVYGHPEDVLAAAASVGCVLAALAGRPVASGALLGLAFLGKQWAVLAALPALLVLGRGHVRHLVAAGVVVALAYVPMLLLTPPASLSQKATLATDSGSLFHPQQVWWFFGVPATPQFIEDGHGTTMAPAWLMPLTRPIIVGLALPLTALWWRTRRHRDAPADALALLALLFLCRCALDPWNLVYYHLPLVLSLTAWEIVSRRRLPWLAVAVTGAAWISFVTIDIREGATPFLLYFAWALPLAGLLAREVFMAPHAAVARRHSAALRPAF